jgi:hypothetical protein
MYYTGCIDELKCIKCSSASVIAAVIRNYISCNYITLTCLSGHGPGHGQHVSHGKWQLCRTTYYVYIRFRDNLLPFDPT